MTKKRKSSHQSPGSVTDVEANIAQPNLRDSTKLTLRAGEAVALTGSAHVEVEMGTAWLAGKTLAAGTSLCLDTDAKFGGPIHIEALPDQQQVPLVTTSCVKLTLASQHSSAAPPKEGDRLTYKTHVLSSAQMTARRYSQPWLQAAEDVVSEVRQGGFAAVAVVGSKGVGKSTLARLLVNSLLEASPVVAYLDTDCGQSDFTVPGLVSLTLLDKPLFGPPHLHMQRPTRCHFIGDLSPQGNPLHYLSSVCSLYDWYWNHSGTKQQGNTVRPPLVVNTHGWIKGLGFEVLAQVLESTFPSHVMQLTTFNPNNNLPSDMWWLPEGPSTQRNPLVYQLPSVGALQQNMDVDSSGTAPGWALRQPPSEQRALQWLAFARQCTGQAASPCSWDLPAFAAAADGLAAHPPYKVPLSCFQVVCHHASMADRQVLQALNGAVVALTRLADKLQSGSALCMDSAATVSGAPSVCLGIGIVRSVDPAKQLLYILTPTALQDLQQATTLEVGKLDLPLALLQTANFMSPYISVWSITADGTGAGAMKARNTLLRHRLKPGD